VSDLFTSQELEELQERALRLASEYEADASLRAALQLLAESAGNLIPKVTAAGADEPAGG
jgi:hypothetical protein